MEGCLNREVETHGERSLPFLESSLSSEVSSEIKQVGGENRQGGRVASSRNILEGRECCVNTVQPFCIRMGKDHSHSTLPPTLPIPAPAGLRSFCNVTGCPGAKLLLYPVNLADL
jgi:hypothetical protein